MADWPTLRVYVDWDGLASATHDFTGDARANMTGKVTEPFTITRGRSLDFSGDANGQFTFRIPVGRMDGSYARRVLVTSGLAGYWSLGETSGTVAVDSAGIDHGTYVATPTLGAGGPLVGDTSTAVTFAAGSSQYVSIPYAAALHPGDTLSLSVWAKRTAAGHKDPLISGGAGDYLLQVETDDKVYLTKCGVGTIWVSTSAYADTNWHHLVATKTGSTVHVYRDGVEIAGTTTDRTLVAAAHATEVGADSTYSTYADITAAHAAIWSRVLTQAEVTALHAAGTTMPVFPAYDRIGRGDVMLGRRVLVLADYTATTGRPLFSGRITRFETDPQTFDLTVTCADDFEVLTTDVPEWLPFEGTFREMRMDVVRRMQTTVPTYGENKAWRNPNAGASRSYWVGMGYNRVANPGFELNTTGWYTTADALNINPPLSFTRTAGGHDGSWAATVVTAVGPTVGSGVWTEFVGSTFKKGRTYRVAAWVKGILGSTINVDIYSNGTHSDGNGDGIAGYSGTWYRVAFDWTPTADRTDVHLCVYVVTPDSHSETLVFDSVAVWCTDSIEGDWYDLTYKDPLFGSSTIRETTVTRTTGTGPLNLGTYIRGWCATGGAAVGMPFQQPLDWVGGVPVAIETFAAGSWTATAWVRGRGTGRLRFGRQGGTTWYLSTTATLNATTWQRFSVTATFAGTETDVWLIAETTSDTIEVAGLVIAAGSTTWDWCPTVGMDGLDTTEDGMRVCRIVPSGRPLEVLKTLNATNFTRHWCEPLAAYPWWRYRTRVPASLSGKTVAETYTDDVGGYTGLKQSYDSLITVVRWTAGTQYFDATTGEYVALEGTTITGEATDAAAVATWGRIAVDIGGEYLEPYSTALTTIPAYILDNYSVQRQRMTFTVENRWPSQLLRDLDDLVVLTLPRLGIVNAHFIIVGITHEISLTGRLWRTTYQVEAAPPGYDVAAPPGGSFAQSGFMQSDMTQE